MVNIKVRDQNTNFGSDTDGLVIPTGTTGERVASTGAIRYNTSYGCLEYYTGTTWVLLEAQPTVTSISPDSITVDGVTTTPVTVTGTNFNAGDTITLTSDDALSTITPSTISYVNGTTLSFTTGATQLSNLQGTGVSNLTAVKILGTVGTFSCATASNTLAVDQLITFTGNLSDSYTMSSIATTGTAGQFSCSSAIPAITAGQTVTISGTQSTTLSSVNITGPDTGTITGVSITGTSGQFSCTSTTLVVGQAITITGTFGGTGSISGYTTGTTYYVIATNGTPTGATTFTLSTTRNGTGVATTTGTPTGLTYTKNNLTGTIAFDPTTNSSGPTLAVGNIVIISGTLGGTGTITGYSDPTTYYIIATDGSNYAQLSTTSGGTAVTTTVGTPTGLTYTASGGGTISGYSNPTTYYVIGTPTQTSFTLSASSGGSAITTTNYGNGQFLSNMSFSLGGGTTGSISGYSSGNIYYITTTNGSTTFTLSATKRGSAITTTAGSPTGWTTYQSDYIPAKSPWDVTVTSAGGKTATLLNALNTNSGPYWITQAGTVTNSFSANRSLSYQLLAESPQSLTLTYSLASGSLPTGVTLSSSGLLSGTITPPGVQTTYNFSVTATDTNGLTATRSFSIAVYLSAIQTFTSSGTFTVPTGLTAVDVLVVAGGGGGSGQCNIGGGGGAGGLIYRPGYPITPGTPIAVTVGQAGYPGGNSIFGGLTAIGGGQGGFFAAPYPGGSGGGGGGNVFHQGGFGGGTGTQPSQPGDSGTYGFGNPGGQAAYNNGPGAAGAGGGGAGGGGGSAGSPTSGGGGGAGRTYSISGSSVEYAAGGGGSPGGGAGGPSTNATNKGGGGGAGGTPNTGGGGPGVVIVSY